MPIFWHLPILINTEGKKLSKRDFGFSLQELKDAGYLPQAICNYLGIIGVSFTKEVLSLKELAQSYNFNSINPTGQITYDTNKLRWVNHQWILKSSLEELVRLTKPLLIEAYHNTYGEISDSKLEEIISIVKPEMYTLKDIVALLDFYFKEPLLNTQTLYTLDLTQYQPMFAELSSITKNEYDGLLILNKLKYLMEKYNVHAKPVFTLVRIALTGHRSGLKMDDLFRLLKPETIKKRLEKLVTQKFYY
jgi:glutamyl/glutaminyl-tRNA synthetase